MYQLIPPDSSSLNVTKNLVYVGAHLNAGREMKMTWESQYFTCVRSYMISIARSLSEFLSTYWASVRFLT